MDMQRKWAIIFALLIVIGVIAVMVPDSAIAMWWGPDAEEVGWEGAEYYCEDNGGAYISDTSGSGEEGWDTDYECADGSYGSFSWNCASCEIEQMMAQVFVLDASGEHVLLPDALPKTAQP